MKPEVLPSVSAVPDPRRAGDSARLARRSHCAVVSAGVTVALIAAAGGLAVVWIAGGLDEGRRLVRQDRWADAQTVLRRYLTLWPDDAEARLLAAEAVVRQSDETGRGDEAAAVALEHLARIPDDSPHGPEARVRSARLLLFIQKKPSAAEAQLRRAIAADPNRLNAHLLLWRILDLTRRSDQAEPSFREVMRLAPERERIAHLRQWYLSQFAPASANLKLDWLLGVLPQGEIPSEATDLVRYEMFRETEPDSPIHIASLARFLLMNGERRRAADLLDGFDRAIGWRNTFFLATRAEAAYELGDTETLDRVLQSWPEPRDGFAFLKWNGVRYEESVGDAAAAVESYRKAAALWPGPTDWQLLFRLANGMTRLGERSEADRLRARSTELEALVGDDVHRPLRIALSDMTNPAEIDRLAAFYSKIDRPFEAGLWREYSDGLRQAAAARDGSGRTSVGSSLVDPFLGGPSGATSSSFSIGPFHPAP